MLQPALSRGDSNEAREGGAHPGQPGGATGFGGTRRGTAIPFITATKEEKFSKKYRVVVMGAAKVGKTAIINQFLYDSFSPKYTKTVEEMHHGEYEVS